MQPSEEGRNWPSRRSAMAVCSEKMEKFKPHLAQVAVQVAYAGMNIITRIALVDGMNHFIFVTYRQIVATLAIAPLAFVLERGHRPPLTLSIFFQTFLLALCGITINQNFYFAGLDYTNSTYASATTNLIPVITFVMATVLRYEKVNIRSLRGKAKVLGTITCVGGAFVITLYKGPVIKMLTAYNSTAIYNRMLGSKRVLGSILLFASAFTWSSWITFQAPVVKKYPAELSLTAMMCMLGAVQSGLVALIFEYKNPSVWAIGWNIELLSYVYTVQRDIVNSMIFFFIWADPSSRMIVEISGFFQGLLCSGFAFFVQTWCVHKKGPVFAAIFNPLSTILVAILECVVFHDSLHVGSVVGAILIVGGLYSVLWGKTKDYESPAEFSNNNNIVGDGDDQQTAIDIKRPLLQNGSHN